MTLALGSHVPMRSRAATLIGVAAAAGAFGAAAMMSAATAPTARADDLAAIETDITSELAYGQTALSNAVTDFGAGDDILGLEQLFAASDDYTIGVPGIAYVGGVEELTNEPFGLSSTEFDFNLDTYPTSFSGTLTDAQSFFAQAQENFSQASSDLSSGDYSDAALYNAVGALLIDVIPQYLTIGGLESLGL